jgi:hypothetical protein
MTYLSSLGHPRSTSNTYVPSSATTEVWHHNQPG